MPPAPAGHQPGASAGLSLQDVLNEVRMLREDAERRSWRDEEAWAAYEERTWYEQEERLSAYCEQSRQHAADTARQMQEANDMHLAQVDGQCKALEEQCEARQKMVEALCKEAGERCQQTEETTAAVLADATDRMTSTVEAIVRKRVDERMDHALQCIAQRVHGVQLSLQATGLGLHDAILDAKIGEVGSESTRSRSRSRSPQRLVQGL